MNQYGKHAQQTWKMIAPDEYAQIPDPEAWFEELGRQAQERVGELTYQIAGQDPAEETYLGKVGRINAAKMQAEEIVRAEMLTPDTPVQEEPDEGEDSTGARILEHQQEMVRFQRQLDEKEELARQRENDQLNRQ